MGTGEAEVVRALDKWPFWSMGLRPVLQGQPAGIVRILLPVLRNKYNIFFKKERAIWSGQPEVLRVGWRGGGVTTSRQGGAEGTLHGRSPGVSAPTTFADKERLLGGYTISVLLPHPTHL